MEAKIANEPQAIKRLARQLEHNRKAKFGAATKRARAATDFSEHSKRAHPSFVNRGAGFDSAKTGSAPYALLPSSSHPGEQGHRLAYLSRNS